MVMVIGSAQALGPSTQKRKVSARVCRRRRRGTARPAGNSWNGLNQGRKLMPEAEDGSAALQSVSA